MVADGQSDIDEKRDVVSGDLWRSFLIEKLEGIVGGPRTQHARVESYESLRSLIVTTKVMFDSSGEEKMGKIWSYIGP